MPGMPETARCRRAMTVETCAVRVARGFKVIFRLAVLGVGFKVLTPTTETTPSTSGSLAILSAISFCKRSISANETSGPASMTAVTRPVSCSGRKPLGTRR